MYNRDATKRWILFFFYEENELIYKALGIRIHELMLHIEYS